LWLKLRKLIIDDTPMRNFTLLRNVAIIFTLFVGMKCGAQQRVTLIERVTSASCESCVISDQELNNLISNYGNSVAVIKYQRGSGNDFDPMYYFNETDTDGRITGFYGVSTFSNTWVDGQLNSNRTRLEQGDITGSLKVPAAYDILISKEINEDGNNLHIEINFKAVQDFSSSEFFQNRAYVVVVEREVDFINSAGASGEMHFEHVMRKILPNAYGTFIGSVSYGEENKIVFDYEIDQSVIDPYQLEVVAFVQNTNTREVFQAATTIMTTGIEESLTKILSDFNIFPNPASYEVILNFNLENDVELSIELVNLLGESVAKVPTKRYARGEYAQKLDISNLTNGIYFATIKSSNQVLSKKFIVSK